MKVVRILLKVVYWLLFIIFTLPLFVENVDNISTKDIILSKLSDITMLIVVLVPLSLLFVYLGTFKRIKLFPNKKVSFKLLSVLGAYFVLAMILVPINDIITSNYSQEYKDALLEITVAKRAEEKKKQEELAAKRAEEKKKQEELAAKRAEEKKKQEELAAKRAEREKETRRVSC